MVVVAASVLGRKPNDEDDEETATVVVLEVVVAEGGAADASLVLDWNPNDALAVALGWNPNDALAAVLGWNPNDTLAATLGWNPNVAGGAVVPAAPPLSAPTAPLDDPGFLASHAAHCTSSSRFSEKQSGQLHVWALLAKKLAGHEDDTVVAVVSAVVVAAGAAGIAVVTGIAPAPPAALDDPGLLASQAAHCASSSRFSENLSGQLHVLALLAKKLAGHEDAAVVVLVVAAGVTGGAAFPADPKTNMLGLEVGIEVVVVVVAVAVAADPGLLASQQAHVASSCLFSDRHVSQFHLEAAEADDNANMAGIGMGTVAWVAAAVTVPVRGVAVAVAVVAPPRPPAPAIPFRSTTLDMISMTSRAFWLTTVAVAIGPAAGNAPLGVSSTWRMVRAVLDRKLGVTLVVVVVAGVEVVAVVVVAHAAVAVGLKEDTKGFLMVVMA